MSASPPLPASPSPLGAMFRHLGGYRLPEVPGVRVRLDANESPFPLPTDVAADVARALAEVPLHRYPDLLAQRLRAALAAWAGVPAGSLVIGNGSDELIAMLCAAASVPRAGQARAKVAFPAPSFAMYALTCAAQGRDACVIPLAADFILEAAALERVLVDERPNLVFLAWPNNPTGTLWSAEVITRAAAAHPDVLFVVDEAYHEYSGVTLAPLVRDGGNVVVLRTLSKIGLAALRLGYAVCPPLVREALEGQRAPYNVGALAQTAAAVLLERHAPLLRAQVARVLGERDRLAAALAARPGVQVSPSAANFVFVRVGTPGDGAATRTWQALAAAGVLVRNFDKPGPTAGCLRITAGTPEETSALLAAWPA